MNNYIPRLIDEVLEQYLNIFGAVLITGPKWCGKTTTVKRHAKSIINFQDQDEKEKYLVTAKLKPSALLVGDKPRLIDEWQVIPEIWDAVRQEVDNQFGREGLFILTGSSYVDTKKIMHSGIGRIARLRMSTLSLFESSDSNGMVSLGALFNNKELAEHVIASLTLDDIAELVVKGGWPNTSKRDIKSAIIQNNSYIDLIANTEMETVDGKVRDDKKVLQLLKSLARHTSTAAADTTILADVLSNNETMHMNTLVEYIKVLRELYVIEDLPAWTPRLRSRATVRTKHVRHFTDPALAASLLNASPENLIYDVETFGLLFESMVIRDLRIYAQFLNGKVSHYRDSDGLECDAVIHLNDGKWAAFEIKLGANKLDEVAANLIKLKNKVDVKQKPSFLAIITATNYGYKREDGVYVVPIGCLKP